LNFLTTLHICCNLKNSQTLRENWSVRLQQNYFNTYVEYSIISKFYIFYICTFYMFNLFCKSEILTHFRNATFYMQRFNPIPILIIMLTNDIGYEQQTDSLFNVARQLIPVGFWWSSLPFRMQHSYVIFNYYQLISKSPDVPLRGTSQFNRINNHARDQAVKRAAYVYVELMCANNPRIGGWSPYVHTHALCTHVRCIPWNIPVRTFLLYLVKGHYSLICPCLECPYIRSSH